ncbi:MAG TPA: lamin tail domain-containing protein [Kofleriaceae bacterium]|nr:lamin tail domain-containing protein [Kofleriaceae bacterium]
MVPGLRARPAAAPSRAVSLLGSLLLSLCLAACVSPGAELEDTPDQIAAVAQAVTIPAKGGATTLDVASWNIEWFGDTANGPTNEALQLQNARDVVSGTDFDIWGFAEIVSSAQWNSLESQLPGYTGFLANEANVINGAAYYSDFSNTEQKVGILYKSALASVVDARVILTASDYDFGGRPPLQVTLRVTLNGTTEDIVVIVLHAKCCSDTASWQRRANAASALKSYLDTTYPTQKVWVIGDWNDDVDTSITAGRASPYASFVSDAARYKLPTQALSLAGTSSTVSYSDTIDHHLNTNEASALYIAGSVTAYRVDQYIASYGTTTSDHFPVLSRYTWGSGGGGSPTVTMTAPNGSESFTGGTSQVIAWSSAGVASVRLEYTLDDGGTWTLITSSTSAAAGTFAWTVPASASSLCRVRISDLASAATDTSDGTFAITPAGGTAQVVVNEILANEPGSNTAGEAIEIVNIGTAAADLGGWTLSDATQARHTFAAGTTLQPGKALVVFGGASAIPSGLTNAIAASTGSLNLSNSGDTVTLKSAAGAVKDSFAYSSTLSGTDGVSMNRSPDGSAGGFVLHTAISSLATSPGTRASGAAW